MCVSLHIHAGILEMLILMVMMTDLLTDVINAKVQFECLNVS